MTILTFKKASILKETITMAMFSILKTPTMFENVKEYF
jgi:hypothetical protein